MKQQRFDKSYYCKKAEITHKPIFNVTMFYYISKNREWRIYLKATGFHYLKLKLFCKVGEKVVNADGKSWDDNTSVMAAINHSL